MQINSAVFEKFPVLQTKRLTLRELRISDAAEVYRMRSNGRVNQFIARPQMPSEELAAELVEKCVAAYHEKEGIGWAGVIRSNGKMIGTCGYNSIGYQNLRAEIGGELSVEQWGKKLAFEAVEAIVNFGFEKMNLHSIEAKVSPENRGAIFLLEQLGFRKEAHFKEMIFFNGNFLDMAVYSLIRNNS